LGFAGNINHVYIKTKPGLIKYSDSQLNYMEEISFTMEKTIPLRKLHCQQNSIGEPLNAEPDQPHSLQ
jgi:hypothetical protein